MYLAIGIQTVRFTIKRQADDDGECSQGAEYKEANSFLMPMARSAEEQRLGGLVATFSTKNAVLSQKSQCFCAKVWNYSKKTKTPMFYELWSRGWDGRASCSIVRKTCVGFCFF